MNCFSTVLAKLFTVSDMCFIIAGESMAETGFGPGKTQFDPSG